HFPFHLLHVAMLLLTAFRHRLQMRFDPLFETPRDRFILANAILTAAEDEDLLVCGPVTGSTVAGGPLCLAPGYWQQFDFDPFTDLVPVCRDQFLFVLFEQGFGRSHQVPPLPGAGTR